MNFSLYLYFCLLLQEKDVRPDDRSLEEFRPTILNIGINPSIFLFVNNC